MEEIAADNHEAKLKRPDKPKDMPRDEQVRIDVFKLVAQIPEGKFSTYGAIAKQLSINPRQVGRILHTNTNSEKYPCHRVLHADGRPAAAYVFGGAGKQQQRLEEEGVSFRGDKAIMKNQFFSKFV